MMFMNFSIRNAVRCSTASRLIFKATSGFFSYNNNFCVRNKTSKTSHNCAASCDTQNKNVYVSREGDTVGHMRNSSGLKAIRENVENNTTTKFGAFRNQWIIETGYRWPSKCSTKGCNNKPSLGAHVMIRSNKKDVLKHVHLVPMCRSCNSNPSKNSQPDVSKENDEMLGKTSCHKQFNNWTFPFQIEDSTTCLELTHLCVLEQRSRMRIVLKRIPWHVMYEKLVSHYKQYGRTSVGGKYGSDTKLLKWVYRQRDRYKTNIISPEEIELLEDIDFAWDATEKQWEENFASLEKFNEKVGHCNVPRYYIEKGLNLGRWLDTQRANRKKGIIDDGRERRLEIAGVIWEPFSHQWEEIFALLETFKQKHGHCNVPVIYQEGGESLREWLRTQRKNKRNGILDNIRQERLTKLGVIMDPITHEWEKMFTLLETFKQKHGHCNVPQRHKEEGQRLGFWLNYQRNRILDNVREKRLTKLGVIMDPITHQWEEMFALLGKFKQKHGHCNVPRRHKEEGQKLGIWLNNQRHRNSNKERRQRFEGIGVILI